MNELINKFSLARDTFLPEMHLRKFKFTYNTFGPLNKNRRKNTKISRNREFKKNLSKQTRQNLLLPRYGVWRFYRFI